MIIRIATYKDAPSIKLLLGTLGYTSSVSVLVNQIETMFGTDSNEVIICEVQREIVGFATVHFFPQLAFDGKLAFISYLASYKDSNELVERKLEEFIIQQAYKRRCERVQVHCHEWRHYEQQFYLGQGYQLYPNFYTKRLVYGE